MKLLTIFIIFGVFFNVIVAGTIITTNYLYTEGEIEVQVENYLLDTVKDYSLRLESYLIERKRDIKIFSSINHVKMVFDANIYGKNEASRMEIKTITQNIADEINEYILINPNKTIKDFQSDEKFLIIMGRNIMKEGYFILVDSDSLIVYYHPRDARINYDYNLHQTDHPDFYEIVSKLSIREGIGGNYPHSEENLAIREKYFYSVPIKSKTSDNKNLSVLTAVYLEEYKESNFERRINKYLESICESDDYENIIFLDSSGEVILNFKNNSFKDSTRMQLYNKIKLTQSIDINNIFDFESNNSNIFISVPSFGNVQGGEFNEIEGFLIFRLSKNVFTKIFNENISQDIVKSIYFIDDKKNVLYDNRVRKIVQKFPGSDDINNCINNKKELGKDSRSISNSIKYKNSFREFIVGTSRYTSDPSGCIFIEFDHDKLHFDYFSINNYTPIIFVFFTFWIVGIIVIFMVERIFELRERGRVK